MSHPGPLVLVDGEPDDEDLHLAARLTARFSKGRDAENVEVEIGGGDRPTRRLSVAPMAPSAVPPEWYV